MKIVSQNIEKQQQTVQDFDSMYRANHCEDSRVTYLTNTDKSTSHPYSECSVFREQSLKMYTETMYLYKHDKKVLQLHHLRGFEKIKLINPNRIVLYQPANPMGNSRSGYQLAKNDSNTDKARLSSKNLVLEKAFANEDLWKYFATFTLDPSKHDVFDYSRAVPSMLRFLRRRHIKYLLVPELHKSGAIHFHALLSDAIEPYLAPFTGKALTSPKIKGQLKKGRKLMNCPAYQDKFGFCDISLIEDREKCINYVTKYVVKSFDDSDYHRIARRRFYASKGLKSPYYVLPSKIDLDEFDVTCFSNNTVKVYLKRRQLPEESYFNDEPPLPINAPPLIREENHVPL